MIELKGVLAKKFKELMAERIAIRQAEKDFIDKMIDKRKVTETKWRDFWIKTIKDFKLDGTINYVVNSHADGTFTINEEE